MHFKLTRPETLFSIVMVLVLTLSLWQINSYTKDLSVQTVHYQANVEYANELLKYTVDKKEIREAKQRAYEAQLRKAMAVSTVPKLEATNTKDLYNKLVVADLNEMQLSTYESGLFVSSVPILSKGKVGSRWETPAGLYSISTKEDNHFSTIGNVNMPYSMQFFGNFFVHGWPTYKDGTEVQVGYSGGCIRLATKDAQHIYDFADIGTKMLIVNNLEKADKSTTIEVQSSSIRGVSADTYMVADIDTGSIYAQKNINKRRPIASITKLLTALTANAVIRYDAKISIDARGVITPSDYRGIHMGAKLSANDTVFPLLMESNNAVAHSLAKHYGTSNFISKMQQQAKAIGMANTSISDASGISPQNVSTAKDLFKLARHIYNNSQFILNVTKLKSQTIKSDIATYDITNHNHFANDPNFIGGKTGYTHEAKQTMLSIFKVNIAGTEHKIAIIILGSSRRKGDIATLYHWFDKYAQAHKVNNRLFSEENITRITGSGNVKTLPES